MICEIETTTAIEIAATAHANKCPRGFGIKMVSFGATAQSGIACNCGWHRIIGETMTERLRGREKERA